MIRCAASTISRGAVVERQHQIHSVLSFGVFMALTRVVWQAFRKLIHRPMCRTLTLFVLVRAYTGKETVQEFKTIR